VPGFTQIGNWESLLVASEIDAVIVASDENQAQVDESLRKLAQSAVPLVVMHPLCDALVAFELAMICEESGGYLVPFFPGRGHPAIERLAEFVQLAEDSPLGPIEEIVMERYLPERGREDVMRWLARDVNLISSLIGQITSVSSIGNQRDDSSFSNLSIHFGGQRNISARWSVGAAREDAAGRVALSGNAGRAILTMPHGDDPWILEVPGDPAASHVFEDWNEPAALATALQCAKTGQQSSPTWQEICRDLDVCENAERSLRRKRTIEVRQDDRSEEGAFKGIMAAGGCALLMLALLGLLLFSVVEGFRMPFVDDRTALSAQSTVERFPLWIRLWPVYPLLIFLLLQPLLVVAKRSSLDDHKAMEGENSD